MSADGQPTGGRGSLTARVFTAWADMAGSMRWLLSLNPSEATILVLFMLSGGFQFLGNVAKLWLDPATAAMPEGEIVSRAGAAFAAALIFRTLALYAFAALSHWLSKLAGGTGSGRDSRAAMAWSALVAAPITLLFTLAGLSFGPLIGESAAATLLQIGPLLLGFALAQCLSEAHGFTRPWLVLAVIAGLIFVLITGLQLLARGI
ncbi:MAG: hypothetical protein AAGC57_08965 [Pseudomonadota bacterium]